MLKTVIHYGVMVAGFLSMATFIGCQLASQQFLDPDRSVGDRIVTAVFPSSAQQSDFVGPGWRLRRTARFAFVLMTFAAFAFVLTSA